MTEQRVEFANTLRGAASLCVLGSHYLLQFWFARGAAAGLAHMTVLPDSVPAPFYSTALGNVPLNPGPFGVALFFLISGFVIPFSLLRVTTASFLMNRAFRIYPVYAAGLLVTVAVVTIMSRLYGLQGLGLRTVLLQIPGVHDLTGTPSVDGVIWTLEIEVRFYLVAALLSGLLRRSSKLVLAAPVAIAALSYLLRSLTPWPHALAIDGVLEAVTFSSDYIVFMFIGVAVNYHYRKLIGLTTLVVVATVYLILFLALSTDGAIAHQAMIRNYGSALSVFAACYAARGLFRPTPVLGFFAKISYPLYVSHPILGYAVLRILAGAGIPNYVSLSVAALLAIGVAAALHYLVEAPFLRLSKLPGWGWAGGYTARRAVMLP